MSSARSFALLVNPHSGGGSAAKVAVPLARRLREAGADVEVSFTDSPAEVGPLVDRAVDQGRVVVSVGGDGMLASVTGPVAAAAGVLAIVPAGRGNDFARMVDTPTDLDGQVALLLNGSPSPIDLMSISSAPGLLVAGSVYAGVDARAAAIVDRSRLPKSLQYPVAAVRALATYRPVELTLTWTLHGQRTTAVHRAANIVIANSRYYGKGMAIAPAASVSDGVLDVIVIEAASRTGLIRALPTVYDGGHVDRDEVRVLRAETVVISGQYADGAPVPVGADGESLPDLPAYPEGGLEISVVPQAVQILR